MTDTLDLEPQTKLDTAGKRALIETELRKDAGRSDREIARVVGCDHKTVGTTRERLDLASPLGNSPGAPSPTEFRNMLIEAGKDFDAKIAPETTEEVVDSMIAAGKVRYSTAGKGGFKCPPPPGTVDEPKFDPFDPKEGVMVVPHQPAIAVYENTQGAIVICQCASAYEEEDPFIMVRPENLDALIVQLRKHLP